jgi:hypothetical protein
MVYKVSKRLVLTRILYTDLGIYCEYNPAYLEARTTTSFDTQLQRPNTCSGLTIFAFQNLLEHGRGTTQGAFGDRDLAHSACQNEIRHVQNDQRADFAF